MHPSGKQERQGDKEAARSTSMFMAMFPLHFGFLHEAPLVVPAKCRGSSAPRLSLRKGPHLDARQPPVADAREALMASGESKPVAAVPDVIAPQRGKVSLSMIVNRLMLDRAVFHGRELADPKDRHHERTITKIGRLA